MKGKGKPKADDTKGKPDGAKEFEANKMVQRMAVHAQFQHRKVYAEVL